jgi:hypothetical protein
MFEFYEKAAGPRFQGSSEIEIPVYEILNETLETTQRQPICFLEKLDQNVIHSNTHVVL